MALRLRAEDTTGASPYSPMSLEMIGQALPGQPFEGKIARGQTVRIMTGAPMPKGADAVLPAEHAEIHAARILIHKAVSPHKHLGTVAEDIAIGTTVLTAPRKLRPQDIGVLSSIGIAHVEVAQLPRVHVVTTGDELLPAGSKPHGYRITDANSPMLLALIRRDGGRVTHSGIVPDDRQRILPSSDGGCRCCCGLGWIECWSRGPRAHVVGRTWRIKYSWSCDATEQSSRDGPPGQEIGISLARQSGLLPLRL